ncbi:MAG TPA: hypothetical protein VFQ60_02250 [Patescibacteria group bacterium]|nr:hypothetical protein [Patescibacteria group bacterium]
MKQERLDRLDQLSVFLRENERYAANGKNFSVDHLYATAAKSRFEYENLLGIYLTHPAYTWMAVWMAVTNRQILRKRQLEYYRPNHRLGDMIGKLGLFLHGQTKVPCDALVSTAYIYLFDLDAVGPMLVTDLRLLPSKEKMQALQRLGFSWQLFYRRNRVIRALAPVDTERGYVLIDEWQLAVVNVPYLMPAIELVLTEPLIRELRERVLCIPHEPGEDYICPSR